MKSDSTPKQTGLDAGPTVVKPAVGTARRALLRWLVLLLLLLIPFLVPIPEEWRRQRVVGALGSQLHVLLFFMLTLFLYQQGPLKAHLSRSVLAPVLLGGAVELLQRFFRRSPRWEDFVLDLIGIGLAACWILWRQKRLRWALVCGVLLAMTVPFQLMHLPGYVLARHQLPGQFPSLADFESRTQRWLWSRNDGGRFRWPVTEDAHGRVLQLSGQPPDLYPGVTMEGFPSNWTAYRWLDLDVRAIGLGPTDSLRVCLRLDNFFGRDDLVWVSDCFWTGDRWRGFSLNLAEMTVQGQEAGFRWDDVHSLTVMLPRPEIERAIQLDNIRLR